ncbi:bone morphogenetic protein 7-like [Leptodactylus fuscus]|uniref:bone morphogenetic protein 7-like n=1 Tax=Leptodactylus fuscus TaxID=238119 RepID=UPI003F4EF53A
MTLTSNIRTIVGVIVVSYILTLVTADPAIDHTIHPSFSQRKLRARERREIQREILTVLGLSHRPRPHFHEKNTSAPMFMMDLYKSMHVGEEQTVEFSLFKQSLKPDESSFVGLHESLFLADADLVMSFVNLLENDTEVCEQCYRKELRFNLSDMPTREKLTAAELKIYKDQMPHNEAYQISVYQVPLKNTSKLLKLDMQTVYGSEIRWLTFDVTGINIDWVVNLKNNLELQLMVETLDHKSIEPRSVGLVGRSGPQEKQPFIVAFFRSEAIHFRSVRSTSENHWNKYKEMEVKEHEDLLNNATEAFISANTETDQSFRSRACMKHELYVSFRELGWQVHFLTPELVPKPCCVPKELQDITVLYFDDHSNILLKKYKNMVVQSCGCH